MAWHFEMLEKSKDNKTAVIENQEPGYNVYLTADVDGQKKSGGQIHVFTLKEAVQIANDFLDNKSVRWAQTEAMERFVEEHYGWNYTPSNLKDHPYLVDSESKFDPVDDE